MTVAELSGCNGNHMTCKAPNIDYLALSSKSLTTPGLRLSGERRVEKPSSCTSSSSPKGREKIQMRKEVRRVRRGKEDGEGERGSDI